MSLESLKGLIGLDMVDLYSADSLIESIRSSGGLRREKLVLKRVSSPHPSEDRYGNIHCTLIQSEAVSSRSAVLYIDDDGAHDLRGLPWLEGFVDKGLTILFTTPSKGETLSDSVAKVLKATSYLNLRRDIIDYGRVFCWGKGELGVTGIISSALDDRVSGVAVDNPALEITLETGDPLRTLEICELLPPRSLALIGLRGKGGVFDGLKAAYKLRDRLSALRLEKESSREVKKEVLGWMLG